MNTAILENAQRILTVLESGSNLKTIRNLAREAGFQNASSRAFKDAFNYLITEEILKLHRSGWSSERGNGNHSDGVILASNIYVYAGEVEEKMKSEKAERILTFPHQHSKKWKHQKNARGKPCSKCPESVALVSFYFCKKYNWEIEKKLAIKQRVCS